MEDNDLLHFVADVIRNAGLKEGGTFLKKHLELIGARDNYHPYEIDKALRLAREYEWIKFPTPEEFVLTKTGADVVYGDNGSFSTT